METKDLGTENSGDEGFGDRKSEGFGETSYYCIMLEHHFQYSTPSSISCILQCIITYHCMTYIVCHCTLNTESLQIPIMCCVR